MERAENAGDSVGCPGDSSDEVDFKVTVLLVLPVGEGWLIGVVAGEEVFLPGGRPLPVWKVGNGLPSPPRVEFLKDGKQLGFWDFHACFGELGKTYFTYFGRI